MAVSSITLSVRNGYNGIAVIQLKEKGIALSLFVFLLIFLNSVVKGQEHLE